MPVAYGKTALALTAEFAQGSDLRSHDGQLRLGTCQIDLALGIFQCLFGSSLGLLGFLVIQIMTTNRGVRQHRDAIRLYFKNTARNEDKLFAAIGHFDTHRTWLDTGNQRRVLRQNAQLARFPWQSYKPSLTRKNGLFCADHIDMESVHRCSWEKVKG